MDLTKNQQQVIDLVKEMSAVELKGLVKALDQAGYETVALDELEGSIVVLYANGDE